MRALRPRIGVVAPLRAAKMSREERADRVSRMSDRDWWRGATLYQIYPRSFADADGDGIGDLVGVTAHLDYVASLGFDAVWLSPFFPSPMRDFGYDVSDYRGVDPIFGSLADFDGLLVRAQALGLKVIIDQVWSHTAMEHPWFAESRASRDNPRADWYVWADARPDGSPPNNWQSWMGGPSWTWEPRRRQYYLHNFLREMPDLNFHCRAVQDAILEVARFWLERGVDGFRLDTANFYFHSRGLEDNPPQPGEAPVQMQRHVYNICQPENLAFLERIRRTLDAFAGRMTIAEISSANSLERMIEYTRGTGRLHTAYSFLLLGRRYDPAFVAELMMPWQDTKSGGSQAWPAWAFSNHDTIRVGTRWAGPDTAPQRCQQLIALLGCLRGTIALYQGEELGLPESDVPFEQIQDPVGKANWPQNKGRDGCRTPMPWCRDSHAGGFTTGVPWLALDDRHRVLAVDVQEADERSTLSFTRRLLAHRRRHVELRLGSFDPIVAEGSVLAVLRRYRDTTSLAAFNLGTDSRVCELGFDANTAGPGIVVGDARIDGRRIVLGPWSGLIMSAQPSQLAQRARPMQPAQPSGHGP